MKQQFLVDIADTIRITVYDKNIPIVPSSVTITLYKPGGDVLQASASGSVNSTTGEMTYSLTTTHTDEVGLNYKAIWAYDDGGTIKYETQLFDIVKSILSIPINDDNLYNEIESLRDTNKQESGTATSATSSTLLDTTKRKEPDGFWKGGVLEILSGTGKGQIREITDFTQSTSTISVTPNFTTDPDSTSTYSIIRSYHYKIEEAFEEFKQMIYNKGKMHQLILESSQIAVPLKYLTIQKICLDLMVEPDDKWHTLFLEYKDKFNDQFNALKLEYDEDDSGTITGDEQQADSTSIRLGRE